MATTVASTAAETSAEGPKTICCPCICPRSRPSSRNVPRTSSVPSRRAVCSRKPLQPVSSLCGSRKRSQFPMACRPDVWTGSARSGEPVVETHQLFVGVKLDQQQPGTSRARRPQTHAGAQAALEFLERRTHVGIERSLRGSLPRPPAGKALDLPHRQRALCRTCGEPFALGGVLDGKQRAAMAGSKLSLFDQRTNLGFQPQQAQRVGHRSALPARPLRYLFLCQAELFDELRVDAGFFNRVQVLALKILDQGYLQGHLVGEFPHERRNLLQPGSHGGTPATLTGHELIAAADAAHDDRLQNARRPNRAGQLLERLFGKTCARLKRARIDGLDRNQKRLLAAQ